MHSSWFFRVKPIARLIFKARNFPEAVQFLTNPESTTVLNDSYSPYTLLYYELLKKNAASISNPGQ